MVLIFYHVLATFSENWAKFYSIFLVTLVVTHSHWEVCLLISIEIGLHHSPDGITNPKYKLLCFITIIFLAFRWDRCCHLVLCLQLIPFHLFLCVSSISWTRTLTPGSKRKVIYHCATSADLVWNVKCLMKPGACTIKTLQICNLWIL